MISYGRPERGLAYRRHQEKRMQNRSRKVVKRIFPDDSFGEDIQERIEKMAAKRRNHLAECSCHMCGNPRKHFNEKTLQERRFPDNMNDLDVDLDADIAQPSF